MDGSGFSFPGLRVVLCFACLIGFGKNGKNRQFLGTLWDVWNQISWVISHFPRGLCDWAAFHSEFCCFLFHPRASSLCDLVTDPCISAFSLCFCGWLGEQQEGKLAKRNKISDVTSSEGCESFLFGGHGEESQATMAHPAWEGTSSKQPRAVIPLHIADD